MNRIFLIAFIITLGLFTGCTIQFYEIKNSDVSNLDWSSADDGSYHGFYGEAEDIDSPLGFACGVDVTIRSGKITCIELIDDETSERVLCADEILERIITAQSLEVDSVSGASISSNTIKLAVKDGAEKALF